MENKPLEGRTCPPCSSAPQRAGEALAKEAPPYDKGAGAAPPIQGQAPFTATRIQGAGAALTYLLGWFYIRWLLLNADWGEPGRFGGWALAVFCAAFFGGVELLMRAAGRRAGGESWAWMAFCGLLAADITAKSFLFWDSGSLFVWELLALHGAAAYWVLCRAGLLTEGATGPFAALDALRALVLYPFGRFFLRVRVGWYGLKKGARRLGGARFKKNTAFWVTLAAALPLLLAAAALLAGADEGFDRLLNDLLHRLELIALPDWFWQNFWCFVLGLPVGAYLFGLIGGALRETPKPGSGPRLRRQAEALRAAPEGALCAAMGAFLALYLLFFALQASYLLGGFAGRLPAGFTAAGYARQGFFQLCAIVVLNFGLLVLAAKLTRRPLRQSPALKALSLCLCGANLLFAAVSFSKLYLYISRFGLTPKRVLSSWFALVLAVLSVLAALSILRPFRAVRAGVLAFCGLFLLLCLCQPDLLIHKVNRQLYRAGILQELDEGFYHPKYINTAGEEAEQAIDGRFEK